MAEILLSALPSASATQLVQSVPLSSTTTQALPLLPPAIAALPHGSLLEGFVINRDAQGNPILRTGKGDFLVQVQQDLFLKTGSEVVIRLTVQNGQTTATLVSVDAKPVAQLLQQQATLQQTASLATLTTLPAPNAPLQAVLLAPASFGTEQQTLQMLATILRVPVAQLPPLDRGVTLQFLVAPLPATPTLASTSLAAPSLTQPPPPSSPNPAASPSPSTAPSPPPTLSATVIGHEGNETIVRTAIGSLKLFTPAPLAVGSQLSLTLIASSPFAPIASPLVAGHTNQSSNPTSQTLLQSITQASQLGTDWSHLREAMELVATHSPAFAGRSNSDMTSRIPNTKSEVVNQVLFFLAALRGNDLQQWLGKPQTDQLKLQSPRLLERLASDFSALRASAQSTPEMPWQMLVFPLMHDDTLHQARLFWRHDDASDNERSGKEDETRFVFDLTLSQLGDIQIDGLVKGQRPHCQLDVVIRSEFELETPEQEDLRALYQSASEAAGLQGQLRFMNGKAHILSPLNDLRAAAAHGNEGSILA